VIWFQASKAVDEAGKEILKPGSDSYLPVQGPVQAGVEGVGFDQFLLSADQYLNAPPSGPVVEK
jgi:hypothetical protein